MDESNSNFIMAGKKEILLSVGSILILSVILGSFIVMLTVVPYDSILVETLLKDVRVLIMNIWPIFCLMFLLYFFTNTMWISFLGTSLIAFGIAEVNRFKITFRDTPLVFSDVTFLSEAKNMAGKYPLFLDRESLYTLIFVLVGTILCFLFVKTKIRSRVFRCAAVLGVGMVFLITCNFLYFEDDTFYEKTWHSEFGSAWKAANQYMSRGVIFSFIRSIPEVCTTPPEGYDESTIRGVLEEYENADLEEEKKVHIISIMLEAYNDFSEFEEVEFATDPYKNFHELQEDSYSGKLATNVFAGETIWTERSFLTGYNNPELEKKDTLSYVRYFKEQGYYTEAMHPCYGWFYDRRNINEYLGFDNFYYYENKFGNIEEYELKAEKYQGLLSDWDFFDYIIEGYENAVENGQKYFNFSVTYQNHGPYVTYPETEKSFLLKKDYYTEDEYHILNNYLHGISRTDLALGKLREYIDAQDEPIVFIIFGDHNPWMGENNRVFEMLGTNLDVSTEEGAANYYQTPYVIYANEAAKNSLNKEFKGEGNTISPMFLMNEYFEYIEAEGPMYLNYLSSVKEVYTVMNPVYVIKNGEFILRVENPVDEWMINQEAAEYYMKNKKIE